MYDEIQEAKAKYFKDVKDYCPNFTHPFETDRSIIKPPTDTVDEELYEYVNNNDEQNIGVAIYIRGTLSQSRLFFAIF